MKLVRYYIASTLIVLTLSITNTIATVLTAPVEPLYEDVPECFSAKWCIDPQWEACVDNCLEQYDVKKELAECFEKILSGVGLVAGGIYDIFEGEIYRGAYKIVRGINELYLALKVECPEWLETSDALLDCIHNCPCNQWEEIEMCETT